MTAFVLDDNRADCRFIQYLLLNTKLGALVVTTALPSLNGKQLAEILITLPPLREQTAIATILSDMDTEIAALETKLAKTRSLKLGMMHNLLRGRIRLL
jgi:type I restriction enzyme S subunit